MPLNHLTDYFNDRFQRQHQSTFRPFIVEDGQASGLFGPVRIESNFLPIRKAQDPASVAGHIGQLKVSTYDAKFLYAGEIDSLIARQAVPSADFESIINFDRLCRTVHMLNYLPMAHKQGKLFLNVDPRHIVGVKQDHGAYFEEVINQCGLGTGQVAIALAFSSQYTRFYEQLIQGLSNYQQRGFQIALRIDYLAQQPLGLDFIENLAPNYVALSARQLETVRDGALLTRLQGLRGRISSLGAISVLQDIDGKKSAALARNIGFDWVQGDYYEQLEQPGHNWAKKDQLSTLYKAPETHSGSYDSVARQGGGL